MTIGIGGYRALGFHERQRLAGVHPSVLKVKRGANVRSSESPLAQRHCIDPAQLPVPCLVTVPFWTHFAHEFVSRLPATSAEACQQAERGG